MSIKKKEQEFYKGLINNMINEVQDTEKLAYLYGLIKILIENK